MPNPEGLPSLEEALGTAAAEAGLEEDFSDSLPGAEPPVGKASEPEAGEQAQQEEAPPDETAEPVFADLLEEDKSEPPDMWATEVELPGIDRPVPLSEMRDGYLRQADYTRKTQALAEQRKQFEDEHEQALRLMRALSEDPAGTAAYLAVKTGVVDEQTVAGKVRQLQDAWKPPPGRDEVEKQLEQRVADAVAQHPAVLQAQQQVLIASIEQDFARIEQKHQLKLTDRDKQAILKRAIDSGTSDLDLVTESMLRRVDRVRLERDKARGAATPRPGVRSPSADTPARIETVEDAFALALAEMDAGG